ncbi:MAG TPA: hypothetical protein VNT03_18445, partial [Baekduia sp.]|nr:hypothetical protein [Baekduia sp.]
LTAVLAASALVVGGVAGAALGPGPTPSLAAASQRVVALVVAAPSPASPVSTDTGDDDASSPPIDKGDAPAPSGTDGGASSSGQAAHDTSNTPAAGTTNTTADDTGAADDGPPASSTTPADTTATPAVSIPAHVWVIAIAGADVSSFRAGGPYAALAGQGALLSAYAPAAPSAAANEIALFSGQVPTADCDADLTACVLPAGETSLLDQLASVSLPWKAYIDDAGLRCAPSPNAHVATSLFTTLRQRSDCAQTTTGLDALDADLADADKTPAFGLLVPSDPGTQVAPLVAKVLASDAYKKDGVLIVVPDSRPAAGDPTAPLGALVLSPRATAGATPDTPTGPVALLRSLEQLLGLDPLATAADAPAGALDGVLAPAQSPTPTTSTPSTTTTSTTRRSP